MEIFWFWFLYFIYWIFDLFWFIFPVKCIISNTYTFLKFTYWLFWWKKNNTFKYNLYIKISSTLIKLRNCSNYWEYFQTCSLQNYNFPPEQKCPGIPKKKMEDVTVETTGGRLGFPPENPHTPILYVWTRLTVRCSCSCLITNKFILDTYRCKCWITKRCFLNKLSVTPSINKPLFFFFLFHPNGLL